MTYICLDVKNCCEIDSIRFQVSWRIWLTSSPNAAKAPGLFDLATATKTDSSKPQIRPHRRCSGRDHPDGINNCKVRFTWGGDPFRGQSCEFLIGRDGVIKQILCFTARNGLVTACARPESAK